MIKLLLFYNLLGTSGNSAVFLYELILNLENNSLIFVKYFVYLFF